MYTIHKYPLEMKDEQVVNLPEPAWTVSVINQYDKLVLYVLVDPNEKTIPRTIKIIGTGHPFPDVELYEFINTVSMDDGGFIWHVFVKMMENPWM